MYYFTLKFANKNVGGMTVGFTLNVSSEQNVPCGRDIEKALINAGFSKSDAQRLSEPTYWEWETAQGGGGNRISQPSAPSNSKSKVKPTVAKKDEDEYLDDAIADELVAAYSGDDSDDDYNEPSAWSYMSFLEKCEYIVKLKWLDEFLDNLPKRILNAILSFIYLEIMAVVWLLASLFSERWRNAVWRSIYKSVKWLNEKLDNSNILSK